MACSSAASAATHTDTHAPDHFGGCHSAGSRGIPVCNVTTAMMGYALIDVFTGLQLPLQVVIAERCRLLGV